jgi:hypothetical protein
LAARCPTTLPSSPTRSASDATCPERQHISLSGERLTAEMVHTLAKEVMALNQQVAELDELIEARFRDHHHFEMITSAG